MWEPEDIGQSSTFRELKAIYLVLLSYVAELKHKSVKIFTDNQGAARIVAIGSSKINLQALAMDIVSLTTSFSKRNISQGHLMKKQIFSADLLTKMTGPSIPLFFELLTPNGAFTQLTGLRRITTPRFQGSILNLPPPVAAALTPCLRIGGMRTRLLIGRSRSEANLQDTSLGLQWLPKIQNVSFKG